MIGNIIDYRTVSTGPECDVVFEPSTHDDARCADGTEWFDQTSAVDDPSYFFAKEMIDTTVRDAVMFAEKEWRFAVTIYLHDKGKRPLSEAFSSS